MLKGLQGLEVVISWQGVLQTLSILAEGNGLIFLPLNGIETDKDLTQIAEVKESQG